MKNWQKKGHIFRPVNDNTWNQSHAQLPIVDCTLDDIWRIYYSTRDFNNRSRISFIDVQAGQPEKVLYISDQPILNHGQLGTFDESGQMCVSIVNHADKKYLFYAGWSEKKHIPYHNSIGLAISHDDGKSFTKFAEGPILDSKPFEPYFTGTACVKIDNGVWRMWYQSCTKWEIINHHPEPFYHIKYAESKDGINWDRKGIVAIDYQDDTEAGICSASVIKEDQLYKMWFCYRKAENYRHNKAMSYRIGYAESLDGISWLRKDNQAGIEVSTSDWDSEMLAYPNVIQHLNKKYMFYNGNGFGQTGFGYATQE